MNDRPPRGFWLTRLMTRLAGRPPETPPPFAPLPPPVAYAPPAALTPPPARKPHERLMSLVKPEPTYREKSFDDIDRFSLGEGGFSTIKQVDVFEDLTGTHANPRMILLAMTDPVQAHGIYKTERADCTFVGRLLPDGARLSIAMRGVRFGRRQRDPLGRILLIGEYQTVKLSLPQYA